MHSIENKKAAPPLLSACFDALIDALATAHQEALSKQLAAAVHGCAYTSASEMLGEVGVIVAAIEKTLGADISEVVLRSLEDCRRAVRAVWPNFL